MQVGFGLAGWCPSHRSFPIARAWSCNRALHQKIFWLSLKRNHYWHDTIDWIVSDWSTYKAKVQKVPQTEAFVSLTRCCISAKAENLIIDCLWVIISFFFLLFQWGSCQRVDCYLLGTSFSSFIAKLTYIINLNLRYLWGKKKKKTIIMWMWLFSFLKKI